MSLGAGWRQQRKGISKLEDKSIEIQLEEEKREKEKGKTNRILFWP